MPPHHEVWWVTGPLGCPNRMPQTGGWNSTSIFSRFWRLHPETRVLPVGRTLRLADAPLTDAPGPVLRAPERQGSALSLFPRGHQSHRPGSTVTFINLIPPQSPFSQCSPVGSWATLWGFGGHGPSSAENQRLSVPSVRGPHASSPQHVAGGREEPPESTPQAWAPRTQGCLHQPRHPQDGRPCPPCWSGGQGGRAQPGAGPWVHSFTTVRPHRPSFRKRRWFAPRSPPRSGWGLMGTRDLLTPGLPSPRPTRCSHHRGWAPGSSRAGRGPSHPPGWSWADTRALTQLFFIR